MASEAGQVYVFDLATGQLGATYTSHAMAVRSLAWSPDGQVCPSALSIPSSRKLMMGIQMLISASEDKRLVMHDARQASAAGRHGAGAVATLTGHSSWVLSADVSPDGRLLLSGYVVLITHPSLPFPNHVSNPSSNTSPSFFHPAPF